VATSLGILGAAAVIQAVIFVASGSVALLADLIHNAGDALTAVPLGIAFVARSARGERWAGYAVVFAIFVSACVALAEAIDAYSIRRISPTCGRSPPQAGSGLSATRSQHDFGFEQVFGWRALRSLPTGTTRGSTASSRSALSRALPWLGLGSRSATRSSGWRSRS